MDAHFRALGLSRGCSSEDLKKAYRQKALEYHPDRNPAGAEAFKHINAAYEALTVHFNRFGGRDGGLHSSASAASGLGFRHARQNQHASNCRHHSEQCKPLFTEEELFGDAVPGGWSTSYGKEPRSKPVGSTSSAAHAQAESHRRRAHGDRVPMSGYSGHIPGGTGRDPATFRSFEDFRQTYHAYIAQTKGYTRPPRNSGLGPSRGNAKEAPADADCVGEAQFESMMRTLDEMDSEEEKHRVLREEWSRLEKAFTDKMRAQREAQDARERAARAEADAQRERIASQQRKEAEREAEDARVRADEAAAEAFAKDLRDARSQSHRDAILQERRLLQKQLFLHRYVPDPADVGEMTDMEVFVLSDLFQDISTKLQAVWKTRMARGPCSRCQEAAKDPRSGSRFTCKTHACLCTACAGVTQQCPICGAVALNPPNPRSKVFHTAAAPRTASTSGSPVHSPTASAPPPSDADGPPIPSSSSSLPGIGAAVTAKIATPPLTPPLPLSKNASTTPGEGAAGRRLGRHAQQPPLFSHASVSHATANAAPVLPAATRTASAAMTNGVTSLATNGSTTSSSCSSSSTSSSCISNHGKRSNAAANGRLGQQPSTPLTPVRSRRPPTQPNSSKAHSTCTRS